MLVTHVKYSMAVITLLSVALSHIYTERLCVGYCIASGHMHEYDKWMITIRYLYLGQDEYRKLDPSLDLRFRYLYLGQDEYRNLDLTG